MESEEGKSNTEFREKTFSIFKDFMARVIEFEELVPVGSRFLAGFHQGLEFLRQDTIDKMSELVKNIINANETKRLRSYLVAGCIKTYDGGQNISKLNTCHVELHDYLTKGKIILSQQESLLENVISTLQTSGENLLPFWDKTFAAWTKDAATADDRDEIALSGLEKHEDIDFTLLMGIIYGMLKQDYEMQVRIVSSLNLKSSSEELESYLLMWSLRPFVDDDVMHQAWKLIR